MMIRLFPMAMILVLVLVVSCCSKEELITADDSSEQEELYRLLILEMEHQVNDLDPVDMFKTYNPTTNTPEYKDEQIISLKSEVRQLKREISKVRGNYTGCQISQVTSKIILEAVTMMHQDELKVCELERDSLEDAYEIYYNMCKPEPEDEKEEI
jgi:hypothetical protein